MNRKSIADQFLKIEREQMKLKEMILELFQENHHRTTGESISDVRNMDSMKMIEEILDFSTSPHGRHRVSGNTFDFVSGLLKFHDERKYLTEAQRFHLETTYHNLFGDS